MASGSGSAAEDRWRRHDADLDGEPEEGEVIVGGAGCHSDSDTEEYYNCHDHCSSESDDETISDCETSSTVAPRWGDTGKRGCSAPAAVSPTPSAAQPEKSMDVVAADAEPMIAIPLAFAPPNLPSSVLMASASANLSGQSSSSQPANDDAMATAAAANPPAEAVVHRERIAPPPPAAGEQLRPHLVRQPPPRAAPAPAGRQDPNGYTCKKCGMWFRNHQGLGGHMVGHKNRDLAAAAAMLPAADGAGLAGAAGGRNPAKPERPHVCDQCGAEFRYGVQLGGHKRKHWDGPRIVPKKKPRGGAQPVPPPPPAAVAADLTLALPVVNADDAPAPSPSAVEAARPEAERTPEPAPRPPAARRVLLFGIDIGPGAKTPTAQQGSPATESSESSTGGEQ